MADNGNNAPHEPEIPDFTRYISNLWLGTLAPLITSGVIDGYIFRIQFGGIGPDDIERCMGMLAEEVVPVLRSMQ